MDAIHGKLDQIDSKVERLSIKVGLKNNDIIIQNILDTGIESIFSKSSQNLSIIFCKWALFPDLKYVKYVERSLNSLSFQPLFAWL